jgi:hypothetical protein
LLQGTSFFYLLALFATDFEIGVELLDLRFTGKGISLVRQVRQDGTGRNKTKQDRTIPNNARKDKTRKAREIKAKPD